MKNRFVLGFLGLTLCIPAQAENLLETYKLAMQNDPVFLAAQQQFFASREIRNQSLALFLPSLNLSADYNRVNTTYSGSIGERDYTKQGYNLSLRQAIFHNDYFAQYRQAKYQVAQASATFNNVAQDLIIRVANGYFNLLASLDNLTFVSAEKNAIGEQLNQTKQRFKVGLVAITDVAEAQSRYDQSNAQQIEAKNLVATSREKLREITGRYPETIAPLVPKVPLLPPEPDNQEEWVKTAKERSLTLIAAKKAMDIAREQVDVAKSGHYPTLDLIASTSRTEQAGALFSELTGDTTDDARVGVQFNLPIYEGNLIVSKTREASYLYAKSRELYNQQLRATELNTRTSFLNVQANISSVIAFRQALKSARTALKATEAGYDVGTRTAVDVLNSRREVFRAERDYARSRYTYLLETLKLRKAAGILTEQDVVAVNQLTTASQPIP